MALVGDPFTTYSIEYSGLVVITFFIFILFFLYCFMPICSSFAGIMDE
jgi:hypothetical protein